MNFAQMLMTPVTPLYGPDELPKKRSGNPHPDHNKGNAARIRYSLQRMEKALPDGEWVPGDVIARRLGTSPASSNKTLQTFRMRGLVESRQISPNSRALEWRWT
jgi:hypothetical protein